MINEQRKIGFDDLGIRANSVDLQLYAPNAYKFIYLGQFFFQIQLKNIMVTFYCMDLKGN